MATLATRLAARLGLLARTATARFLALQLAVVLGSATLVLLLLAAGTASLIEREVRLDVAATASELVALAGRDGMDALAREVRLRTGPGSDPRDVLMLADADGRRIAGNLDRLPDAADRSGRWQVSPMARTLSGADVSVGLVVRPLPGGRSLLVGRELDERRAVARLLARVLALGLALLSLAALLAGLLHARFVFGRLREMLAVAEAAERGIEGRRVRVGTRQDEFDRLAQQINRLLAAQEGHLGEIRLVTDSLAHDIRAPLFRIRQAGEAARSGRMAAAPALAAIERESGRLLDMVTMLLDIARARSGAARDQFETLDLADLLRDLAELHGPAVEEAGRRLDVTLEAPLPVPAHRQFLTMAVSNLLDNALRHGAGAIGLDLARHGGIVRIAVHDRGPGIAPAGRSRALARFGRLDESRTSVGSGLGLSLAQAVAQLHGGELRLEDNAPGLRAVIELPAPPPASTGEGDAPVTRRPAG